MKIRVRFARNVLGRKAGTTDWVLATPIVEALVNNGSLRWLDAPPDWEAAVDIEPEPEPVKPKRVRKPRKPKMDLDKGMVAAGFTPLPEIQSASFEDDLSGTDLWLDDGGWSQADLDELNESP